MAYNTIWNEYYRDQNLQDEVNLANVDILYRAWEKDYFTSALPWTQKGGASELPVTSFPTYREVIAFTSADTSGPASGALYVDGASNIPSPAITGWEAQGERYTYGSYVEDGGTSEGDKVLLDNITLTEGTVDVNDLRQAIALQHFLERDARAGTRYTEHLLAHWDVYSSDGRLQRPEYLGGGRQPVTISEVLQTSKTETGAPRS